MQSIKDDLARLQLRYPSLIEELLESLPAKGFSPDAIIRLRDMLNYNVLGGESFLPPKNSISLFLSHSLPLPLLSD